MTAPANTVEAYLRRGFDKGLTPNRLIREKSPYLLQHAFNPVDWHPWGPEAFERARAENKPIFLSIGYSTCHWCHVMAHESFESADMAALINADFVPVKVDREERPDVDRIYMMATQAISGHGGWPMTVFLTPDLRPFFAGTYFPPASAHGRPGLRDLLGAVRAAWTSKPGEIAVSASQVGEFLNAHAAMDFAGGLPGTAALEQAAAAFVRAHDPRHGGFGPAPKFPRPSVPVFLMREHARSGDAGARDAALGTLRAMAAGGLRDHLGGGFHRYSVDEQWRVSHFEKMLYDQAQLAVAYLEAFQLSGEAAFAQAARDTLDYVRRDLAHPQGAFHSAEDADSPLPEDPSRHAEGAFYLWTADEVRRLLGDDAELFCHAYGVQEPGNALSDPHDEFGNRNVLYRAHTAAETAQRFDLPEGEVAARLERARAVLFEARARRPRPHLDDKVIASWNGLMISAFARGAQVLDEPAYHEAAARAADFVLQRLRDPDSGALRRRFRDGEAAVPGQLDDYAFVIQGLLDLYEAGFNVSRLVAAVELTEKQVALFHDASRGGFFDTAAGDAALIVRTRDATDAAEPCGNSVAALNLLRLSRMLGDERLGGMGRKTLSAFAKALEQTTALPQMLAALDFALSPPQQVVVTGRPDAPDTRAMLREVHRRFLPHRVVLLADGGGGQAWLAERLEFIGDVRPRGGRATAFVCDDFVCGEPLTDPAGLGERLDRG